ncbi:trp operon leader peptide [Citrobacter braakii]
MKATFVLHGWWCTS